MIENLKLFIAKLNHTVKREDVEKTLEFVLHNLNNEVIPSLDMVIDNSNLSKIQNSSLLTNLGNMAEIKFTNNKDILVKIKGAMANISKASSTLDKLVSKELNEIITDKAITAKDAAIMKVISDIGSMNSFLIDFLYLISIDEDETDLPKIKIKYIRENMSSFSSSYKIYSDNFNKLLKDIYKVSEQTININEGKESMINIMLAKTGKIVKLPRAAGFVNNPIYHIRMWMVDNEIAKYESLKDKKRLLELKLMELKLKEGNESDPKLRKQIEYFENKISKIEYEIEKIEKD